MPSWNSKFGKWSPAREYAVDARAPKGEEVYDGPDRAALLELKAQGVDFLGEDYRLNTDMLTKARSMGYKNVEEYVREFFGFDPKEEEKKIEVKEAVVNEHKAPERKKGARIEGGGINTANGAKTREDMEGGFGEAPKV